MIKLMSSYLKYRWHRFYFRSHWHLAVDLILVATVIILAGAVLTLYFYRPELPAAEPVRRPAVIDLSNPPLAVNLTARAAAIKAGEAVELSLDYLNPGRFAVQDLTLELSSLERGINIAKLELVSTSTAWQISGSSLSLAELPAGGEGEVIFKAFFSRGSEANRRIRWQGELAYDSLGQTLKERFVLGDIALAAELAVRSYAYYTSPQGDQLGIGPMPPQVGLPTSYWLFWEASAPANFRDVVLSARLPQGVELGQGRSVLAGKLNYNSATRQVVWSLEELAAGSKQRVGFEVVLTPTFDQAGQVLPLITNPQYFGIDTSTGREDGGAFSRQDTELEGDRFHSGQGKVVAE